MLPRLYPLASQDKVLKEIDMVKDTQVSAMRKIENIQNKVNSATPQPSGHRNATYIQRDPLNKNLSREKAYSSGI